jgi:hypothetical protein
MAHLDVAVTQQRAGAPPATRCRRAGGDALLDQQLVVLGEEVGWARR